MYIVTESRPYNGDHPPLDTPYHEIARFKTHDECVQYLAFRFNGLYATAFVAPRTDASGDVVVSLLHFDVYTGAQFRRYLIRPEASKTEASTT